MRVRLRKPLGIVFEETKLGEAEGVTVADLVEDGNAWKDGRVLVGDRLAKTSAVILGGESPLLSVGGGKQYTEQYTSESWCHAPRWTLTRSWLR